MRTLERCESGMATSNYALSSLSLVLAPILLEKKDVCVKKITKEYQKIIFYCLYLSGFKV